ncbi:MAG: histidinol dehydrogenase, partial [Thermodesulfovibrionales bacterium]
MISQENDLGAFLDLLRKRGSGISGSIVSNVDRILKDARRSGDRAVMRYTKKFDRISPGNLRVSASEVRDAARKVDSDFMRALERSANRICRFHERQREHSWSYPYQGAVLGQMIRPVERVGVYVPGGKAAYPSSVLMNVIPAQVAGVKEICLCVPTPHGELNPYVMAAVKFLGLHEVFRIGGAQAVGAMAFGTKSVRKVDKIVGPGNIYVATAKRLVFGEVDIDMIAGPSEVLVVADAKADPRFVAADLLSQAEHDEFASSICITSSRKCAQEVRAEVELQLRKLKRARIARSSLRKYGAIIVVRSLKDAARIANLIAPEHLEIMTTDPSALLPHIKNAGAIFLGKWTPEPVGDYAAGPSHVLPTGGAVRFASPLGVYDFVVRSSLICYS